jgi:radical SAM superfamily enzyme YgiQ (UPF0313 family)
MKTILFYPKLEPHKDYHYFPVSLLSAAAPMVAKGIDVEIIDERVGDILPDMSSVEYFMVSVYAGYQVSRAYAVSKFVKKNFPGVKVVWGGPFVSACDPSVFNGVVDHIVQGDVDDGTYPLPYWLIDVEKYINPETKRFIYVTSYGCPGVCTFCATKKRRPFKALPIERVHADIKYLMGRYPFEECVFFDATLFADPNRVGNLAVLMEHYGIRWIADARAPEIARAPDIFLRLCIKSGLKQLTIGLESGSPRIVDLMRKGKNHLEHFKQAAEKLRQFPVKMVSGVIFGCPGETVDDLRQTIEYVKQIRAINPNFRISTTFYRPLPDTLMADICIKDYGYKQPDTLQGWAEQGERGHYVYNEFQSAPWVVDIGKHKEIYTKFKQEYNDLFV